MEIRRVVPDEWEALRERRLRAPASDPDAFGGSLEEASARADAEWLAWVDAPERAIFVAVAADGRYVGMAVGSPAPERGLIGRAIRAVRGHRPHDPDHGQDPLSAGRPVADEAVPAGTT